MSAARMAVGCGDCRSALLRECLAAVGAAEPPEVRACAARRSRRNPPPDVRSFGKGPAWDGKAPPGVQPLARDMFTSKDFYKDRDAVDGSALLALQQPAADRRHAQRRRRLGHGRPAHRRQAAGVGALGRLQDGLAAREHREPLSRSRRAKEHYAGAAWPTRRHAAARPSTPTRRCRSGTASTASTCPRGGASGTTPAPTRCRRCLSLLTPEYQQRMVRQIYHEGVNAAHQWSASYCWPEGFMRQWATGPKPQPHRRDAGGRACSWAAAAATSWRVVHLNREFPLGQDVPQWYGDTIGVLGRRRADHLRRRTSRAGTSIRAGSGATSSRPIEILTPVRDAAGKFLGSTGRR